MLTILRIYHAYEILEVYEKQFNLEYLIVDFWLISCELFTQLVKFDMYYFVIPNNWTH